MTEIIITSLISVAIAVVVTRYFTERMALNWCYSRRKVLDLIGGKYPEGIETFLDGVQISNLVEWKIAIWNSGNRPIREAGFVGENSITISFTESEIMKAEFSKTSRDVIGSEIVLNLNKIIISDLKILDSSDYLMLTCYGRLDDPESGLSKKHRPTISANIARIPKGASYVRDAIGANWVERLGYVIGGALYVAFGVGLIIGGLSSLTGDVEINRINEAIDGFSIPSILSWLAVPFGILMVVTGIFVILGIIYSLFYSPPKPVRSIIGKENMAYPKIRILTRPE